MTDKEYREFLEAVGKRYLRLQRERFGPGGSDMLRYDIERLSRTFRFVQVVSERPDEISLYQPLGNELEKGYAQEVFAAFERTGVSEALDAHGEIIFANLSTDVIPNEDTTFLREAGVLEPEAELIILVYHGRQLARSTNFRTSDALKRASTCLAEVAKELAGTPPDSSEKIQPTAKPKKYFNGIAKIVSGAILGGGNLLIGTGSVIASGGAAGAAVIASCAAAVAAIGQGVGDLRGE